MSRCGCGGACACSLTAGTGTTVTGAGTAASPWVVSATTNCTAVRLCISAGPGINYNSTTGVISADVSNTAGNQLTLDPNGLFVPAGTNAVTVGCGLSGNGTAGSPITVDQKTWPFACPQDSGGATGVYCDPVTGVLHGDPERFAVTTGNTSVEDLPVGALVPTPKDTVVRSFTLTVNNPDPCRDLRVMWWREVDVDFRLPPNADASMGIDADDMRRCGNNTGSTTITTTSVQVGKMTARTVPAGGSVVLTMNVTMGDGSNGATWTRIQTIMRIWGFSI